MCAIKPSNQLIKAKWFPKFSSDPVTAHETDFRLKIQSERWELNGCWNLLNWKLKIAKRSRALATSQK